MIATLGTGTIPNESGTDLPEIKRCGYPLAWLITDLNGPTKFSGLDFALDATFWTVVALLTLVFLREIVFPKKEAAVGHRFLVLLIVLFIPASLFMSLLHESGHAIWGISAGGTLEYMKVAYFEVYPQLAISPPFQLGRTIVSGLNYGSAAYGLMLLGGSMTTHIVSWILCTILLGKSLRRKPRIVLKVLGLFGVVDLPFYVVFPQVGLRHWIFLGGSEPEPLNASRMIGMSDSAFYMICALLTVGLLLLYSKVLRAKILTGIRNLLRASHLRSAELFLFF